MSAKNPKVAAYISDPAWNELIQQAYQLGYVRGAGPEDRPRGMSAYVLGLSFVGEWKDARPEWVRGTSQWVAGVEPTKERCLHLSGQTVAALGNVALEHGIWPYKTQMPVVNGYRREVAPPLLHAPGATPVGATSIKALVGPVLEAIGLGWLVPAQPMTRAPATLYAAASRRASMRAHQEAERRSMLL